MRAFPMINMAALVVALSLGWVGVPTPALAQRGSAQAKAARDHYENGKTAYRLGDFDTAIAEWKEAYKLKPDSTLLYNIAQAFREKGDFQSALFFYRQYLNERPDAANRADIEEKIATLEKLIDEQKRAAESPPKGPLGPGTVPSGGRQEGGAQAGGAQVGGTQAGGAQAGGTRAGGTQAGGTQAGGTQAGGTQAGGTQAGGTQAGGTQAGTTAVGTAAPPTAPVAATKLPGESRRGGSIRIAGLATAGAGVAAVTIGVVFALRASGIASEIDDAVANGDPWSQSLQDKDDSGRTAATIGAIGIGVGAAAIIGGGTLYYLGRRQGSGERHAVRVTPGAGSAPAGITFGLDF